MKGFAVTAALMIFGTTIAGAPAMQKKPNPDADRIMYKVHRLLLVDQLLPVLMTKEQIKKVLPVVERARQNENDREKKELEELKKLEPKVDAALEDALKHQKTTTDEFDAEYNRVFDVLKRQRKVLVDFTCGTVLKELKGILNEGQLKAAEKALDPRLFGEQDPDSLSSDDKLKIWIREVLLDRSVYDVLVDMS